MVYAQLCPANFQEVRIGPSTILLFLYSRFYSKIASLFLLYLYLRTCFSVPANYEDHLDG